MTQVKNPEIVVFPQSPTQDTKIGTPIRRLVIRIDSTNSPTTSCPYQG